MELWIERSRHDRGPAPPSPPHNLHVKEESPSPPAQRYAASKSDVARRRRSRTSRHRCRTTRPSSSSILRPTSQISVQQVADAVIAVPLVLELVAPGEDGGGARPDPHRVWPAPPLPWTWQQRWRFLLVHHDGRRQGSSQEGMSGPVASGSRIRTSRQTGSSPTTTSLWPRPRTGLGPPRRRPPSACAGSATNSSK